MSESLISVDIECSGPIIGTHSVLQLGACAIDDPGATFVTFIKPISQDVDQAAMEIVGKPIEFFMTNGLEPTAAMAKFEAWVRPIKQSGDLVFVGFNAAFDWGFVNWYFMKYLGHNPFGAAPLDIKAYYAGASGVPWSSTRSSRLPGELKPEKKHTHDALADAVEQGEIFRRMRAKYHGA